MALTPTEGKIGTGQQIQIGTGQQIQNGINGLQVIPLTTLTTGFRDPLLNGKVFTKFNNEDVIKVTDSTVTTTVWSNNAETMSLFHTSSTQVSQSGIYYYNAYNYNPTTTASAEIQFAIAYGNRLGSGSTVAAGGSTDDTSTRAIYSQFKNLVVDAGVSQISFDGTASDDFYAITFNRARIKDRLDEGNWQLKLQKTNSVVSIVDIKANNTSATGTLTPAGYSYPLYSGSLTGGIIAASGGFGTIYPDLGLILLNPTKLDIVSSSGGIGLATGRASNTDSQNNKKLFDVINSGSYFVARNEELVTSTHYIVRIKNQEYNFSNNPTYVSGSQGIILADFINDPITYITTVGLYNDRQELLAVAKMSQPIPKKFNNEALIQVKLDF